MAQRSSMGWPMGARQLANLQLLVQLPTSFLRACDNEAASQSAVF